MSKQLVMKFTLQLHKPPKCLQRKFEQKMGALENQAEQTWTSHQVVSLNEMHSDASNALENQRRSLLSDATPELQRHQKQSHEHLQEYQRHLSEVQQEVQVQQIASAEEVEHLRHEVSQYLVEGSPYHVRPKIHQKFSSCDTSVNI